MTERQTCSFFTALTLIDIGAAAIGIFLWNYDRAMWPVLNLLTYGGAALLGWTLASWHLLRIGSQP